MFQYMIEEGDLIYTLMVSYYMQKDVPSSDVDSFALRPSYPLPFFSFLFNFPPDFKGLQSTIETLRYSHSSDLSSLWDLINKRDELILR